MIANANCPIAYPIVYIIGADPTTEDGPYIASEFLLSMTCSHQPQAAEPETEAPTPETSTPEPPTPEAPPAETPPAETPAP